MLLMFLLLLLWLGRSRHIGCIIGTPGVLCFYI